MTSLRTHYVELVYNVYECFHYLDNYLSGEQSQLVLPILFCNCMENNHVRMFRTNELPFMQFGELQYLWC